MKATGIVRRIDDLGRVVIPKEIRRTMRIREGEPLEIYTTAENEVIFKKYSPLGEIVTIAAGYAEVIQKVTGVPAIVCDRDHVVAVSGLPKKELLERRISSSLDDMLNQRKTYVKTNEEKNLNPIEGTGYYALICQSVIVDGDVVGAIMLVSEDPDAQLEENQVKLTEVCTMLMVRQLSEN